VYSVVVFLPFCNDLMSFVRVGIKTPCIGLHAVMIPEMINTARVAAQDILLGDVVPSHTCLEIKTAYSGFEFTCETKLIGYVSGLFLILGIAC